MVLDFWKCGKFMSETFANNLILYQNEGRGENFTESVSGHSAFAQWNTLFLVQISRKGKSLFPVTPCT